MDLRQCDKQWVALQVRPRYEFVTANILRSKGYEEFLPVYATKRKWSDRTKTIVAPLFRGYVFCKMDKSVKFPVITTPGVIRIVGSSSGTVHIGDDEIETIRMAERSGREVQPWAFFNIGDRVQINAGPLAGLAGVLVAYQNKHRLVISVDLIQSSMAVEVEGDALTLIEQTATRPIADSVQPGSPLAPFTGLTCAAQRSFA
jgi:transcription antitermination factor NusG